MKLTHPPSISVIATNNPFIRLLLFCSVQPCAPILSLNNAVYHILSDHSRYISKFKRWLPFSMHIFVLHRCSFVAFISGIVFVLVTCILDRERLFIGAWLHFVWMCIRYSILHRRLHLLLLSHSETGVNKLTFLNIPFCPCISLRVSFMPHLARRTFF